jgi:hypothetical protein
MADIEYPDITQAQKTGYPNLLAQPEHAGTDITGDEILEGDTVIELPNNELLLETNLEDYLIEELGFKFYTAK